MVSQSETTLLYSPRPWCCDEIAARELEPATMFRDDDRVTPDANRHGLSALRADILSFALSIPPSNAILYNSSARCVSPLTP